MKLIQELMTSQPEKVSEGYYSGDDLARFKKIASSVEDKLEALSPIFADGSNFAKLIEKLGGDMSHFKDAKEAFDKLYDTVHDLHMYTDMTARANEDEK
jgi:hypothetical protein